MCDDYDTTSLTDIVIVAKFKDRKETNDFVKRDLSLQYIEKINTNIVLITVKEDFQML